MDFLDNVLASWNKPPEQWRFWTFIVPSRRACVALREKLLHRVTHAAISPSIITIEEFAAHLASLEIISGTSLLMEFYGAYLDTESAEVKERFYDFLAWAPGLLVEFDALDREMQDVNNVFRNLLAIKDIQTWELSEKKPPLVERYLSFWRLIPELHENLVFRLKEKGFGYSGLCFREALENLEHYIQANKIIKHCFIGFNALTTSESGLIQELLQQGRAEVFWDADTYYMERNYHQAGAFMRKAKDRWPWYKKNEFKWISDFWETDKGIRHIKVPNRAAQAKAVAQLLSQIPKEDFEKRKVALILGDERLLIPILDSIPENVSSLNITMGYPLDQTQVAQVITAYFKSHSGENDEIYYKDLTILLDNPIIIRVLTEEERDERTHLFEFVHLNNVAYLTPSLIKENNLLPNKNGFIDLLLAPWEQKVSKALTNALEIVHQITEREIKREDQILWASLYKLEEVLEKLRNYLDRYPFIDDTKELVKLFEELVRQENLEFIGEPLSGLQIMGLLESRVLDFERVIITSMNEGVVPSAGVKSSLIPNDLKRNLGLPTYQEREAVIAYHFYRLLHRVQEVYLLSYSNNLGLGKSEPSRFILQLELDPPKNCKVITEHLAPPVVSHPPFFSEVTKNEALIESIKAKLARGISPSAFSIYLRSPFLFYQKYILRIDDIQEVEESMEARTIGTVLHEVLQSLYMPYINQKLNEDVLDKIQASITVLMDDQFNKRYGKGTEMRGRNVLIRRACEEYIQRFLNQERDELKSGYEIIPLYLEHKITIPLQLYGFEVPVQLTGSIDRVDLYNSKLRIVDYKSGKVAPGDLKLSSWSDLVQNHKREKVLQLLLYAYMFWKNDNKLPATAGIYSFRNLNKGFMPVQLPLSEEGKKASSTEINPKNFIQLEQVLTKLILEILDINIPFREQKLPEETGETEEEGEG